MSKKPKFSNPAMKQSKTDQEKKDQFNLVTNVNSFNAVFDLQELDKQESQYIDEILRNNWIPDALTKKVVEQNSIHLKTLTTEIKSISRQGSFLIGERVVKAREMLKPYRDGTFTLWLESTFGSRRSGYNMLAYYELFTALPDERLRSKYKSMPQKAAYVLANRKGDIQHKIQIIDKHSNLKCAELLSLLQKEFSVHDRRSRRTVDGLLRRLHETVDQLSRCEQVLTKSDIKEIKSSQKKLQGLLS